MKKEIEKIDNKIVKLMCLKNQLLGSMKKKKLEDGM